jgi:HEAT repeat protein
MDIFSERNDVRYNAAVKLGELNNPVIAPILAYLLFDKEWDVRSIALENLIYLRDFLSTINL